MTIAAAILSICLYSPVSGPIVAGYAPVGAYGGHWGVDLGAAPGEAVHAPVPGTITFAGSVAGMMTVTIQPQPDVKVSVSYLATVEVTTGAEVAMGEVIGTAGLAHGVEAVHLSVRVDGHYVDPSGYLACASTDITRALRLVTPPRPYPRRRGHGHLRRNVRPDTSGTPGRS